MRIIKISDGFVTNSSTASGVMLVAVRKGKDLKRLIEKLGIPDEFSDRFEDPNDNYVETDDLEDEYDILEASVLIWANEDGLPEEGEENPLRWFIDDHDRARDSQERVNLVGDDLILLYCSCDY